MDYFRTANRYTLPTTLDIARALRQEDITVVGFESIQWYGTDTPTSSVSLDQLPEAPHARKVYDVRRDAESGEYRVDTTEIGADNSPFGLGRKLSGGHKDDRSKILTPWDAR